MSPTGPTMSQPTGVGLDLAEVFARAQEIDDLFRIQLEKGLFDAADSDPRISQINDLLFRAYTFIRNKTPEQAVRALFEAESILLNAFYGRHWMWRFWQRFHPLLVGYFVLLLGYLFIAGSNIFQDPDLPRILMIPGEIWGIPVEMFVFGAGGAILRGIYWLMFKTSVRQFRPHFNLAYFLAPWVGALFGGMVYVVVRAGLWTFQGTAADASEPWGILGVAALAGYSWEWITGALGVVLDKVITGTNAAPAVGRESAGESVDAQDQDQRSETTKLPTRPTGERTSAAAPAEIPDQPT